MIGPLSRALSGVRSMAGAPGRGDYGSWTVEKLKWELELRGGCKRGKKEDIARTTLPVLV